MTTYFEAGGEGGERCWAAASCQCSDVAWASLPCTQSAFVGRTLTINKIGCFLLWKWLPKNIIFLVVAYWAKRCKRTQKNLQGSRRVHQNSGCRNFWVPPLDAKDVRCGLGSFPLSWQPSQVNTFCSKLGGVTLTLGNTGYTFLSSLFSSVKFVDLLQVPWKCLKLRSWGYVNHFKSLLCPQLNFNGRRKSSR